MAKEEVKALQKTLLTVVPGLPVYLLDDEPVVFPADAADYFNVCERCVNRILFPMKECWTYMQGQTKRRFKEQNSFRERKSHGRLIFMSGLRHLEAHFRRTQDFKGKPADEVENAIRRYSSPTEQPAQSRSVETYFDTICWLMELYMERRSVPQMAESTQRLEMHIKRMIATFRARTCGLRKAC